MIHLQVRRLAVPLGLSLSLVASGMWAQATTRASGAESQSVVSVADLPITEVPTTGRGRVFAIFLSGDGGWVTLDERVSAELSAHGIPVVGLNSRQYLWSGKTPAQVAGDLARMMIAYGRKWGRDSVVVVGYSRGAGIAPFAVNRLPAELRGRVTTVALIGAEHGAGFHFHLRDLVRTGLAPDDVLVLPELKALGATRVVCFYGADETDTLCPELAPPAIVVKMTGGHHLDGSYAAIGQRIVSEIMK
jgi:type IV secretory pathway VirJ component